MGLRSSSLYPCRDSDYPWEEERFGVITLVNIMDFLVDL